MVEPNIQFPSRPVLPAILLLMGLIFGLPKPHYAQPGEIVPTTNSVDIQATVMDMADDYIAALGETVYLLARSEKPDAKWRWMAQWFLRNGVGASLDIATGPNPPVSLLDLLVLVTLQAWSFEVHWIPAGIGKAGIPALARLKRAEADLWGVAGKILSKGQLHTLRGLIDVWIKENPDRTVVSLVRFNEFADERRISSLSERGKAHGLLKEVSAAGAAIDEARFFGERLLWFAGRYPYLLGEQAELTAYRLLDQPEGAQLFGAIESLKRLSDVFSERIRTIHHDLENQQKSLFAKIAVERADAIVDLRTALEATLSDTIDVADKRFAIQRTEAINQFFDRLAQERTQLFDELASRESEFLGLMIELEKTITVSGALARELTETVNAIDKVVGRFDKDTEDNAEPLRLSDVRDAAIETGRAADRITLLLERTIELLESDAWERKLSYITAHADAVIEKLFWRGAVMICLLIAGLLLLRIIPIHLLNRKK